MTVTIYSVEPVVQAYAKETGRSMTLMGRRYTRLIATKRFRDAFPSYPSVALVQGPGEGSYAYLTGDHSEGRCISLGGNRCEAVLLHEIAHHVAYSHGSRYGREDGHGPGFASALLDVVRVAQGAEAERALRHMYKGLRIRVYRAGSAKGVLPRTAGPAPDKAQAIIDRMLSGRAAEVRERAAVRQMLRRTPNVGTHTQECPICSTPGATLRVSSGYSGRMRLRYGAYAQCGSCDLAEYLGMTGQEMRAFLATAVTQS
jgi:hypothetical protein